MKTKNVFKKVKAAIVSVALATTALVTPFAVETPEVDAAVDINYAKALQYSLYLYDANMCGKEVGEKSKLDWRDDCHTYDSSVSTPYGTMDLSGGFHDAGDHVKFGMPGAYSASMLGWGYYEFEKAFTSTGQAGHLQTITDYFCDYFKRCTVMNGSTVQAFCIEVGEGNSDHGEWCPPEKQTLARPVVFATSSNPATDIVAETAAALALNYINFGNTEDLTYAKALYEFAKSNNKSAYTVSFYQGDSYLDDLAMAAITLYKATNSSTYKSDCANWISQSSYAYTSTWPLCWGSVWPAVNALYGQELNRVAQNIDANKKSGYTAIANWGSARYNTALQLEGLVYDKYNNSSTYSAWAKEQMEYLFGNNSNNQCYMVGYSSNSVTQPHHRAASGYNGFPSENRGKAFAHVLVGALVGGPDQSGAFYDDVEKYEYTEVALDYNAAFVGALAGLYLKYGSGDTVDSSVPGVSGSTTEEPKVTTTTAVTTKVTTTTKATTNENGEVTTTKKVTTSKVTTAKVTTVPSQGGSGSNEVDVNEQIDYSNSKNCNVNLKDLLPSGATAKKIIVNLSANGDLGTLSCGGGITLSGGNWQQLSSGVQSGTGSDISVTFDVSAYGDNLDRDYGVFQFSYWWGNQQSVTVDSIVCEYTSDSIEPVVTTAKPAETEKVTTTKATTVKTTTAKTSTTKSAVTTKATTSTVTEPTQPSGSINWAKVLYGDVNLDGTVEIADMVSLAKFIASSSTFPLDATAYENADCEYDGTVNSADLSKLAEFNLRNITKLGK